MADSSIAAAPDACEEPPSEAPAIEVSWDALWGGDGLAAATNTDRTVYGAASASASSFVVHHTQQISKAAVVGDAENINKQARKERTDWINKQKNKQATNGFLSSAPVGGARAA